MNNKLHYDTLILKLKDIKKSKLLNAAKAEYFIPDELRVLSNPYLHEVDEEI